MLETLQGIEQKSNFRNQHRLPRMSDIEVPTLFPDGEIYGHRFGIPIVSYASRLFATPN